MKYLLHVFLLLLPWHAVLADPVECYSHNAYDHPENCSAYPGCQVITYTGGYFCATKCTADQLQYPDTCNNYAGCKWNSNVAKCQPFTENRYRAWDAARQVFVENDCPPDHPYSQPGTDFEGGCYKLCNPNSDIGNRVCGFYKDELWQNTVSCLLENTNTLVFVSEEFHIENTDECRLNERDCEDFEFDFTESYNNVSLTDKTISGTAHWIEDANQYDTSECSMIASFRDERSVMQCNTKRLCPTATYNVPSASTHIQYNNGLTSNPAYYYCESCLSAGYYPTTDKPTGQQHHLPTCNNPTTGEYTACSCVQIHKGYYGDCQNAWASTMPLSQCQPRECPFGETTNGPGSIGSESCRFGSSTRICDDAGCINLNGVGDLSLGDWQMLP